jgi:hypothetical protein
MTGVASYTVTCLTPGPPTGDWTITVNRTDAWAESYDIITKDGAYPTDPADGVFIANLPIGPAAASASDTYTAPTTASTWKWAAIPRRGATIGPMALLT